MKVQFLYSPDCPNIDSARGALRSALQTAGLEVHWDEVDLSSSAGASWSGYGSPTILVDGQDIAGRSASGALCCRLYEEAGVLAGAPSPALIGTALTRARRMRRLPMWVGGLSVATVCAATCPACWPAYLSIASSLLTPAASGAASLLILTVLFATLAPLFVRVRQRRQWAAGCAMASGLLLVLEARWLGSLPLGGLGSFILAVCAMHVARAPMTAPLMTIQRSSK